MATTTPDPRAARLPVVSFRDAGKCFHLRPTRPFLLREAWQAVLGRRDRGREFWALRDVSLEVRAGESVAFMGANGAGKSTLLGLIAKTITPTTGRVDVRGRVGALLELGAGFHPDLTGRENIYLNASLLGMQRAEVESLYDRIVEFSELHEFIDQPLRSYSSGMQVRLGFSVAIHLDPDVLIMDEVLAVGDQSFQHKCVARIDQLHNQGKTLLFVSHTPDVVRTLCQRVVWLDHGRVRRDGGVAEVLAEYEASAT